MHVFCLVGLSLEFFISELPFLEGLTPVVNTDQQSDKPVEITLEAPDIMKKKK